MKNNSIKLQDFERISNMQYVPWEKLRNKNVFVTGGTGLIGQNFVKGLLYANKKLGLNTKVSVLVRNEENARDLFEDELKDSNLTLLSGDVRKLPAVSGNVDYIVHGASVTSSTFFQQHPVETIEIALDGTRQILELAKEKEVSGMVFLSTMEVYGHPERHQIVTEEQPAGFNPANPRNCYPLSKLICESLCASYAAEYGLNIKCIRLTQTFGPGVLRDDSRVFAEFMRAVLNHNDIILKTRGETERCYLYTADCVTAILTVLLSTNDRQFCYNAANPETYCSILEMAKLVAEKVSNNSIQVQIQLEDISKFGYADTLYMNLDITKLRALGWMPEISLEEMFQRMIQSIILDGKG